MKYVFKKECRNNIIKEIEIIIKKQKDIFMKNYSDELFHIFLESYKSPSKILINQKEYYTEMVGKHLNTIFSNIISLQNSLNISYFDSEINKINELLEDFTIEINEIFFKFLVTDRITYKTSIKQLDTIFKDEVINLIKSLNEQETHRLIVIIKERKDTPNVIYQRKAFTLSIISIIISILTAIVTISINVLKP